MHHRRRPIGRWAGKLGPLQADEQGGGGRGVQEQAIQGHLQT
jgi:hypothetical protein